MILGMDVVDVLIIMVGVSLLPLFIDVLNTFIPVGRLVHTSVSRLLVTLLSALYGVALFYFFSMVIPFYLESSKVMSIQDYRVLWSQYSWTNVYMEFQRWKGPVWVAVTLATIFAVWIWANAVYCYWQTINHSPSRLQSTPTSDPPLLPKMDDQRHFEHSLRP